LLAKISNNLTEPPSELWLLAYINISMLNWWTTMTIDLSISRAAVKSQLSFLINLQATARNRGGESCLVLARTRSVDSPRGRKTDGTVPCREAKRAKLR